MRAISGCLFFLMLGCGDATEPTDAAMGDAIEPIDAAAMPITLVWERLSDDGPAASSSSMAALGDRVVLFGGVGDGGANDYQDTTWIWQDGAWSELSLEVRPIARRDAMFGEAGGELVLFSGVGRDAEGSVGVLDDTWAFDGTAWRELSPAPGPEARQNVAYTSHAGSLCLHGGAGTSAGRLPDGWCFDGTRWTELPLGPPAQRAATLTSVAGELLLTGGSTPGPAREVWRLDGDRWTEIGAFSSGRAYHGAAAIRGHLVVFGGVMTSTTAIGTTDAFPGPATLEGEAPPATQGPLMVSVGDGALMHVGGSEPSTWRLSAR